MANQDAKTYALIGALLPIIGFIIISLAKKGGKYAMYYGKHGLALGIVWIVVIVVGSILAIIPFVGAIIYYALQVIMLILWILGIVNSQSGKQKGVLVIEEIAKQF